jgi:hypothetical protein
MVQQVNELHAKLPSLLNNWHAVATTDLASLNAELRKANLPEIKLELSGVVGVNVNVLGRQIAGEE